MTGQSRFVIQKHLATRTHFDLRLEHEGRLLSWAITKGPSLLPADKRLAVRTEDHPVDYIDFEGIIPDGYGKGRMILWDYGEYEAVVPLETSLPKGEIKFILRGHRLNGQFALVRLKEKKKSSRVNWLMIKDRDVYATDQFDPAELFTRSVVTGLAPEALTEKGSAVGLVKPRNETDLLPYALAESSSEAPSGPKWVHEIKYDGYRVQVDTRNGLRMFTRKGLDWTSRYPGAVNQLKHLPAGCVLDGEIIANGPDGRPTFSALHSDLEQGGHNTKAMLFDALIVAGRDVRDEPLLGRRLILRNLAAETTPGIVVDFLKDDGPAVLEQVEQLGLEGIVSKRRGAPYPQGRSPDWLKTKLSHVDGFIIGGFRLSRTRGRPFASLLLGTQNQDGSLQYRGRVGSGFNDKTLSDLASRFKGMEIKDCPFDAVPRLVRRDAVWLKPELGAQVEFAELTSTGQIRHGRFIGLREDIQAITHLVDERVGALPLPLIRVTSPLKIVDTESGRTKRDVVAYYEAIAEKLSQSAMLRPVIFVRAPDGTEGETFFQRNASQRLPTGVRSIRGLSALAVDEPLGFARMAQNKMLEVHMMGSTVASPALPTRMVFDLDPDEGLSWERISSAATLIRAILQSAGFAPSLLATGGNGLHLVCDLKPSVQWRVFSRIAKGLAYDIAAAEPKLFTASQSKSKRAGRIYLDWMRNRSGATAIAPWSLRARRGLPIAYPINWADLTSRKPPKLSLEEAASAPVLPSTVPTVLSQALATRYAEQEV